MKDLIKLITTVVIGCIPAALFIWLWSWTMTLVPTTFAYAWLAKIAITFGMVIVGGSFTIVACIFAGVIAAYLTGLAK